MAEVRPATSRIALKPPAPDFARNEIGLARDHLLDLRGEAFETKSHLDLLANFSVGEHVFLLKIYYIGAAQKFHFHLWPERLVFKGFLVLDFRNHANTGGADIEYREFVFQ